MGEGHHDAVTIRIRCEWATSRECGELLHGKRLPKELKVSVYKSYVRPAAKYGTQGKIQCRIDKEIPGENNMWSIAQRYKKKKGIVHSQQTSFAIAN